MRRLLSRAVLLLVLAWPAVLAAAPVAMRPAAMRPAAMKPGAMTADAMKPGAMTADAMKPDDADEEPPADAEPVPPEQQPYRSIHLEAGKILWLEPGQAGLIEAHPLVMGLAAMALATVTLLFFFLRGVKRPRDNDL